MPTTAIVEPPGPPWFVDVTEDVGLNFIHDPGPLPTDQYFMPQIMGSGAALFDFDNDGRLDIYLIQNAGPHSKSTNRLFRQTADGKFVDGSVGSGLDITGYGMGVAIADVNNDALPDVCVTEYGATRLFLNLGQGKFQEISKEAGIDNPVWGASACFADLDRDGWLDLVVINYVDFNPARVCGTRDGKRDYCHPNNFEGLVPRVYRNLGGAGVGARSGDRAPARQSGDRAPAQRSGDRAPTGGSEDRIPVRNGTVRFEDITVSSGLARVAGAGLGGVCADFTGDGWPDIFLANDNQANRLWINQRNGTFTEEAVLRGVAFNGLGQAPGNMGVALGDVDGDGYLDLFVTHLTDELHTLWKQGKGGMFEDRTGAAGLATPRWRGTGFGTVLADFDHDGFLDLSVVNGRVARGAATTRASAVARSGDRATARDQVSGPDGTTARGSSGDPFWNDYAERCQLFANDGTGRFRDISMANDPFCGTRVVARGLAWGDYDGDGAVDLLVTTIGGPARLYRNAVPKRGHWLLLRAIDPALGSRDAYGAEITVQAGQRRWVDLVNPGQSYLVSGDPRVHFGLGTVDQVDSVHVVWPDGAEESFPGQALDRQLTLRKGEGTSTRRPQR
jgi:hypothetical protein